MGYMLDADWSRQILLRCDWLVPTRASFTTFNEWSIKIIKTACGVQVKYIARDFPSSTALLFKPRVSCQQKMISFNLVFLIFNRLR